MKKLYLALSLFVLGLVVSPAAFAGADSGGKRGNSDQTPVSGRVDGFARIQTESLEALPVTEETSFATQAERNQPVEAESLASMDKNAMRQVKRQARKMMWKKLFSPNKATQADMVLIVILTILIPPLGVYLYEQDLTVDFWVDLILTLVGFWILGIIYGILVITGTIDLG